MLHPALATRRLRHSVCALTLILIGTAGVRSAHAQTGGQDTSAVQSVEMLRPPSIAGATIGDTLWLSRAPGEQSSAAIVRPSLDARSPGTTTRGPLFAALEASYIGLQALDVASTLSALDKGYVEGNPLMRGLTAHPAALIAVKAAATGGTVLLARRIAGRNRMAGILLTAALDGAYSYIVARNFALSAGPARR